jgi:hypothetical protein
MKRTITTAALLAASLHAEKPRTCYWYSHGQHMADSKHARFIKVNGQLKAYTAARASQDGTCRPPESDLWHDYKLVARDPGDRVESVEPQPQVK